MAEQIEIILSADASDVTAELQKAENNLKKFQTALKKATSVGEINYLTNNIRALEQQINSLNQSNQKFAAGSNKAAYALNDLSRIAQDAPYGFIGIQNNINPLLESFQRLQKESKDSGGAINAMLGALSGPAGLGLAVGVVSALLVVFNSHSSKAKNVVDELSVSVSDLKYNFEKLQQGIKDTSDALEFQAKLKTIQFDINNTDSYVRSIGALKIQLDSTSKSLDNGITNTKYYLQAITDAEAELYRVSNAEKQNKTDIDAATQAVKDATKAYDENIKKNGELALQKVLLIEQIKLEKVNQLEADKKKKQSADSIDKTLKKLNEDLKDQKQISIAFDKSTLPEQMRLVEEAIKKLISDFNLSPNSNIIMGLMADVSKVPGNLKNLVDYNELAARVAADAYYAEYQKKLAQLLQNPKKDHILKIVTPKLELTDLGKKLEDLTKQLNSMLDQVGQDVAISFATSLGDAMSGKGFESFFTNMYVIIAEGMINIGKAFVKYAIELGIIKKALESLNPVVALAGGLALIAFGTMLKNKMTKTQAFAVGTRNAPGGMSLVGERGPELINIPRGSSVIPAAQTSNMLGGMGGAVEVFGVLRGQDIYFSNKKYGLSYGRQT